MWYVKYSTKFKKKLIWILFFFIHLNSLSQENLIDYLKKFTSFAVQEMEYFGIPASIKLGQGILESSYGNGILPQLANNHFGIKCGKDWTGSTFIHSDDNIGECFRKYVTSWHSFRDHSNFLKKSRYSKLFSISVKDYKSWAKELQKSGYATAKDYSERIIAIIETYKLWKFDRITSQNLKLELDKILSNIDFIKLDNILIDNFSNRQYRLLNQKNINLRKCECKKNSLFFSQNRIYYHENDNLKYIILKKNETLIEVSYIYNISLKRLIEYNELLIDSKVTSGQYIFLERKKDSGIVCFYKVKEGEDMYYISQKTGIKLEKLYYRNRMNPGEQPFLGTILYLQGIKNKT